jgi:hypothetical protein
MAAPPLPLRPQYKKNHKRDYVETYEDDDKRGKTKEIGPEVGTDEPCDGIGHECQQSRKNGGVYMCMFGYPEGTHLTG